MTKALSYCSALVTYSMGFVRSCGILSFNLTIRPEWGLCCVQEDEVKLVQAMHSVGYDMLQQSHLEDKFAGCMLLQVLNNVHVCFCMTSHQVQGYLEIMTTQHTTCFSLTG